MTSEENQNEPVPEYKYTEKERNFEEILSYLKEPKDYKNFFKKPDTGNPDADAYIESRESIILNYGHLLPTEFLLDTDQETAHRLEELFPDLKDWVGEISHAQYSQEYVDQDLKNRAEWETFGYKDEGSKGWMSLNALPFAWNGQALDYPEGKGPQFNVDTGNWESLDPETGEYKHVSEIDWDARAEATYNQLKQERFEQSLSTFATQAEAWKNAENNVIPVESQPEETSGFWQSVWDKMGRDMDTVKAARNQMYKESRVDYTPEERQEFSKAIINPFAWIYMGFSLGIKVVDLMNFQFDESNHEQEQVNEMFSEAHGDLQDIKVDIQNVEWSRLEQEYPEWANEILEIADGDRMFAASIWHGFQVGHSPEFAESMGILAHQSFVELDERIKKLVNSEDTLGEVVLNNLGWWNKYVAGSIASGAFLILNNDDARALALEQDWEGLHKEIKKADYSPSKAMGLEGTLAGSLFDLSTMTLFDPAVWFFTPGIGGNLYRATTQYATKAGLNGFMKGALGQRYIDDTYRIIKEHYFEGLFDYNDVKQIFDGISDANLTRLKNVVKKDIKKGTEFTGKATDEFRRVYMDGLYKGDMPFQFKSNMFTIFKHQSRRELIRLFSGTDEASRVGFGRLMTERMISKKVALAGDNGVSDMRKAFEAMVYGSKASKKERVEAMKVFDEAIEKLSKKSEELGTGLFKEGIAKRQTHVLKLTNQLSALEILLGFRARSVIGNLGTTLRAGSHKLRSLVGKDDILDLEKSLPGIEPFFNLPNKELLKKYKTKLKELKAKGASSEEIAMQTKAIDDLEKYLDRSAVSTQRVWDETAGKFLDNQFNLAAGTETPGTPESFAFLKKMIDEIEEATKAIGATDDIGTAKELQKYLDDLMSRYEDFLVTLPKGGTAPGGKMSHELLSFFEQEHYRLLKKLNHEMTKLNAERARSVRNELWNIMLKSHDELIHTLKWHESPLFEGAWYALSEGAKVTPKIYRVGSKKKKWTYKDKDEVLKKYPDAIWVDNPFQPQYTKAGKFKGMDVDWQMVRMMMDFGDNVGLVTMLLRGSANTRKYFNIKNNKLIRIQRIGDDALDSKYSFIEGRKMSAILQHELKQVKLLDDTDDLSTITDAQQTYHKLLEKRGATRTQMQVVDGEMPLSPLEFMLVDMAVQTGKVGRGWWRVQGKRIGDGLDSFMQMWALEKVARPATATVAALDEVMFYRHMTGGWLTEAPNQIFKGLKGQSMQRQLHRRGGLEQALKDEKFAKKYNAWVQKKLEDYQKLDIEIARRYQAMDSSQPLDLLKSGDPGFWQYAHQHLESILSDYGFQQYAKNYMEILNDLKAGKISKSKADELLKTGNDNWIEWFNTADAAYLKSVKLIGRETDKIAYPNLMERVEDIQELIPSFNLTDSKHAWQLFDNQRKWYTMGIKNQAHKDDLWLGFIKAGAERAVDSTSKALPKTKHIGRMRIVGVRGRSGTVTGTSFWKKYGSGNEATMMQQMFGNPAWERANYMSNKFFAMEKTRLENLFRSQNKTIIKLSDLTDEISGHIKAVDPKFQQDIWGHSYHSHELWQQGYVTQEHINALAQRYAKLELDNFMLKFHLASPVGKKIRHLAPFGKAWADFWGRHLKALGRRSQFRGNWWAFGDTPTAVNWTKRQMNNFLGLLPNVRTSAYISRMANASLEGEISNPFHEFTNPFSGEKAGIGPEKVGVDFSGVTFLPNGQNPIFAVNPISGPIPILGIATWLEYMEDSEKSEIVDWISEAFPSTDFVPSTEKWANDKLGSFWKFLAGGGIFDRFSSAIADPINTIANNSGPPLLFTDVSDQLVQMRATTDYLYTNADLLLAYQPSSYADLLEYTEAEGRDAQVSAVMSEAGQASRDLLTPIDWDTIADYQDVSLNWIEYFTTAGLLSSIIDERTLSAYKYNPNDPQLQRDIKNELSKWWFEGIGAGPILSEKDHEAKKLLLIINDPRILFLVASGYKVRGEEGASALSKAEAPGQYYLDQKFSLTNYDNTNAERYREYLNNGWIVPIQADEKLRQVLYEHARQPDKIANLIMEKLAEIVEDSQITENTELALEELYSEDFIEFLKANPAADKDFLGWDSVSDDLKNSEDVNELIKRGGNKVYTFDELGPEFTALIKHVLRGTEYEDGDIDPLTGTNRGGWTWKQIIPHIYADSRVSRMTPNYVFGIPRDESTISEGIQLLTGLVKSGLVYSGNPEELEFLESFVNKVTELQYYHETNNKEKKDALGLELMNAITIMAHQFKALDDYGLADTISWHAWWDKYIKANMGISLDWTTPLPPNTPENYDIETLKDNRITWDLVDGGGTEFTATFSIIEAKRPRWESTALNTDIYSAIDGDTLKNNISPYQEDNIRIIGIMANEITLDPMLYPEELDMAMQQWVFLQEVVNRYSGRLYYVTDRQFGDRNHVGKHGRKVAWLFVDQGINGDLAPGMGHYIFFPEHFGPSDGYYKVDKDNPVIGSFAKEEEAKGKYWKEDWDLGMIEEEDDS